VCGLIFRRPTLTEKLEQKREAIAKEILSTEQTYVKNLEILCSVCAIVSPPHPSYIQSLSFISVEIEIEIELN
jgi:hypothetical protein